MRCINMVVINSGADKGRIFKCLRIPAAAFGQPSDQFPDRRDAFRAFDFFRRLADPLSHPCEIKKFQYLTPITTR